MQNIGAPLVSIIIPVYNGKNYFFIGDLYV